MDWKALLGEDFDEAALAKLEKATDGMKLVDLSEGAYVAKEKFDKAISVAKKREDELTAKLTDAEEAVKAATGTGDATTAQLDALNKQLADVKAAQEASEAKATRLEHEALVGSKIKSPKLAKLALIEAEARMDDDTDFAAALDALIDEDPDYAPADTDDEAETAPAAPARVASGKPGQGAPGKTDPAFALIDKAFGVAPATTE